MANVIRKTTQDILGQLGTRYVCDDIGCCSWYDAKDVDAMLAELNAKLTIANASAAKATIELRDVQGALAIVRDQRNGAWDDNESLTERNEWQSSTLVEVTNNNARLQNSVERLDRELADALAQQRQMNRTNGQQAETISALRNIITRISKIVNAWWNAPMPVSVIRAVNETITLCIDIGDECKDAAKVAAGSNS